MRRLKKISKLFAILVASIILFTALGIGLLHTTAAQKYYLKKYVYKKERLSPIIRLVQNGRTYCSGTVINSSTIITAAHCVTMDIPMIGLMVNPNPIEIRASDDKPINVLSRVTGVMIQLDRAVLKGNFIEFEPADYISDVAESVATRVPGAEYTSCGYPLGGPLYCGTTIFVENYNFFLRVSGVLIPAMSGGPTFYKGKVIGVNTAVQDNTSIISPFYGVDLFK